MKTYEELYAKWYQILNRNGGVYVEILGVKFNIEEIGKDGDKIDMTLIPISSLSKCSLLVTYEEFEGLLNSVERKPMGKVAKVKFLIDKITREVSSSLQYSIVKDTIQPILVNAFVDLPELYPDGSKVEQDDVEKAIKLFRVRLERIPRQDRLRIFKNQQ